MTINIIRYTGRLPASCRPVRGRDGNKRQRKKWVKRQSQINEAKDMLKILMRNLHDACGIKK